MNIRLLPLLACALACSTVPTANSPPKRPTPTAARAPRPEFIPAPSLLALAVPCRSEELPQPNAVDDDCDGLIDGQAADFPLVTLAYRKDAALRVVLQGDDGPRALDASCEAVSFCVVHVNSAALSPGRYELRVESLAPSADALPTSVAVSKSGEGEARTYLAELTQPGETKALGTVLRE